MALFDGSWEDITARLRDDDLVTLNLLATAADIIERFGIALTAIERLGHSDGHNYGHTCGDIASRALDVEGRYTNITSSENTDT